MVKVYTIEGKPSGEMELPRVFETPYRPDIIRRAVLALQASRRQPYGTNVLAGKRTSAHYHGMRHYIFTMMNRELARMPRIHGKSAHMMRLRARFVPQAVGGRKAHPPKAGKKWELRVNKKEMQLAVKSALAAGANPELLKLRGHAANGISLPVIVDDNFENLGKAKEVEKLLRNIGLEKELERCAKRKVRAGKGKMRGRRYKNKKGPLVLAAKDCPALRACRNIPGIDAVVVPQLNAELLAPGTHAGRLLVITKSALGEIEKAFG